MIPTIPPQLQGIAFGLLLFLVMAGGSISEAGTAELHMDYNAGSWHNCYLNDGTREYLVMVKHGQRCPLSCEMRQGDG